jgi:hypothetical protein
MSAVMESAAFVEAAINEVLQDSADEQQGYVADLPAEAIPA